MMMKASLPDIACQRCGSTVPWNPYCSHCDAYLEFAGVPPWSPDGPSAPEPPEPVSSDQLAAATDPADGVESIEQKGPVPVPSIEDEHDAGVVPQQAVPSSSDATESEPMPEPLAPATSSHSSLSRLLSIVIAALGPVVMTFAVAWVVGGARTATLFTAYVAAISLVVLWVVNSSDELPADPPIYSPEPAFTAQGSPSVEHTTHDETGPLHPLVESESSDLEEIEARPPQAVERTVVVARTRVAPDVAREVWCPTCSHPNLATRNLCEACGAQLGETSVRPATMPVLVSRAISDEAKPTRQRRRGVSRSWVMPTTVFGIVVAVLASFALAFFGPAAFQFRFGTVRIYQAITRWVDPYSGQLASVVAVSATSSLPGSDPSETGSGDARTFWASAALPNFGAGSALTFTFAQPTEIDRMIIYPGIQSGLFEVRALATPKDVTLTFDDGTSVQTLIEEVAGVQQQRQLVAFDAVTTSRVVLTIDSVYPPIGALETGTGSVALSGTEFLKVLPAPAFFGVQDGPINRRIPGMN